MSTPPGPMTLPAEPAEYRLSFNELSALSAAYMSLFSNGGLFIPTVQPHQLGDAVGLTLQLPDDPESCRVQGQVAWISPSRVQGGRSPGIGLHFGPGDQARQLQRRIEALLGSRLAAERPTHTL